MKENLLSASHSLYPTVLIITQKKSSDHRSSYLIRTNSFPSYSVLTTLDFCKMNKTKVEEFLQLNPTLGYLSSLSVTSQRFGI